MCKACFSKVLGRMGDTASGGEVDQLVAQLDAMLSSDDFFNHV
jgi:hypothetical protein